MIGATKAAGLGVQSVTDVVATKVVSSAQGETAAPTTSTAPNAPLLITTDALDAARQHGRDHRFAAATLDGKQRGFIRYSIVLGKADEPLTETRLRSELTLASAFALTAPNLSHRLLSILDEGLKADNCAIPEADRANCTAAIESSRTELQQTVADNLLIVMKAQSRRGHADGIPKKMPRAAIVFAQGLLQGEYDDHPTEATGLNLIARAVQFIGYRGRDLLPEDKKRPVETAVVEAALDVIEQGTALLTSAVAANSTDSPDGARALKHATALAFKHDSGSDAWSHLRDATWTSELRSRLETNKAAFSAVLREFQLIDPTSPFETPTALIAQVAAFRDELAIPELATMVEMMTSGTRYEPDPEVLARMIEVAQDAQNAGAYRTADQIIGLAQAAVTFASLPKIDEVGPELAQFDARCKAIKGGASIGLTGQGLQARMARRADATPEGRLDEFDRSTWRSEEVPPEVSAEVAQFLIDAWRTEVEQAVSAVTESATFDADQSAQWKLDRAVNRATRWPLTDTEAASIADLKAMAVDALETIKQRRESSVTDYIDDLAQAIDDYKTGAQPIPDAKELRRHKNHCRSIVRSLWTHKLPAVTQTRAKEVAESFAQLSLDKTNAELPAGLRIDNPRPWDGDD